MPEIIEVKFYADCIKKYFLKRKLLDIKIIKGRYKTHGPFSNYTNMINELPLKLQNVNTKGKFTYLSFNDNYHIGITLGLSGGWFYKKHNTNKLVHAMNIDRYDKNLADWWIKKATNNINIEFVFDKGVLCFYDSLSYGTIKIFKTDELNFKLKSIGLDIMDVNSTAKLFMEKIYKPKNYEKYIGNILMNQKLVAGIGNYLRADSLWLSKISPFRKVKNITPKEYKCIFNSARLLVWGVYNYEKGVELGYIKKKDKLPFHYGTDFFIYSKKKDIYGNEVTKEPLHDGPEVRNVYWVKNYQK